MLALQNIFTPLLHPHPQGMSFVGVPVESPRALVRLWAHECLRIFHDRLVDETDRAWFRGLLARQVEVHMGIPFAEAFPTNLACETDGVVVRECHATSAPHDNRAE